jgi:FMN phosphatase YigB (HAD superfamily)
MIVIFDLDYTLLNTVELKKGLAEIFINRDFYADYKNYFKDRRVNFDSEIYLKILKKQGAINEGEKKELILKLKKLITRLDDYLFPEAAKVLRRFKAGGNKLILITFGDKKWHKKKIKNLSISRYFNRIILAARDKRENSYLKLLSRSKEEVVVINDNAKETQEMIKIIGRKVKVILLAGPYSKNIKHNWPIRRLSELI